MNENIHSNNPHPLNSHPTQPEGNHCASNEVEKRIEALKEQVEEVLEELVDLEEYALKNCAPPKARAYRIRIDKQKYTVHTAHMTGAEILAQAGKTPQGFGLQQKIHGGAVKTIKPTDVVDFTTPGIERFMTLPLDQNDGGL